jgi:aromatic-L-amino-acid decarboxylase
MRARPCSNYLCYKDASAKTVQDLSYIGDYRWPTSLARDKGGALPSEKSFHMTTDDFRRHGHEVVDWLADYFERIESFPVLSQAEPGQLRASLPSQPPAQGEPFEAVLQDVEKLILPGITHWQSPNFFAYFPCNNSGASILGDLLSSGLGVQGMLWATSPACTELETHVLDWLVYMLDLPQKFLSSQTGGGVIQDTASSASLCALLAARERATKFLSNTRGCHGKLVAYTSAQAHSSIEKAVQIAGLGRDNLRLIEVDENFAMRPDTLAKRVQADRQNGLVPCFVCTTVGTTSSNAIDPLHEIGRICHEQNIWLHVDAAMSGTAALCPEFRHIHRGLEFADSYCFNPHKWMFTNFDCDCFYVADRKGLIQTLSILPEYLKNKATETGAVIDYRDWQIPLGRRFRSLKLWFVIRHYGVQGLQHHVREHVRLAQQFATWVRQDKQFEIAAPAPLNLVCFRHRGGDQINQDLMDALNRSGDLYLTHTRLNDRLTLRFCVGQTNTQEPHVRRAWDRIQREANKLAVP